MNLKIDKMIIQKFRKMIDIDPIVVGKKITVISGVNGVGKSNLLSLIASGSGSTKAKSTGGNFQPYFTEFFKLDNSEPVEDYRLFIQYKNIDDTDIFTKRISFKNDTQGDRGIRVIPRTTNFEINSTVTQEINRVNKKYGIGGSARVPIPTIFLSLSRLYPIGESELFTKNITSRNSFFQNEANLMYKKWYNIVLPGSINNETDKVELLTKNATKSKTFYIPLESTTAQTQSVGQDNLGHIISSLVDFYTLSLQPEYSGGILCIDEIDASLHPSAQQRLFDLLNILADELNLQIFFSTHSLTLLKQIIYHHNKDNENYNLIYFKDQRYPFPTSYINYRSLKADLFDEMKVPSPKVKLYCEDKDTKEILELLLVAANNLNIKYYNDLPQFETVPVFLGCEQLMKLPDYDSNFTTVSILLDGDARIKDQIKIEDYIANKEIIKGKSTINHRDTIVFLPNFLPPESYLYSILYEYVNKTDEHLDFWRTLFKNPETANYTSDRIKQNIIDVHPLTNDTLKSKEIRNQLFDFCKDTDILTDYYRDNRKELENFVDDFHKSLKIIQKKLKARGY
ncbi:ATP-binding protein [Enterococcus casseliflavus]|uniref:ATP-binding protein n=1 Tax=Enterococcus casseliflavus TaxID=37734 RepID=UPI0011A9D955|nr:ATP-binding protein [Enterococcus casseliflavus]